MSKWERFALNLIVGMSHALGFWIILGLLRWMGWLH